MQRNLENGRFLKVPIEDKSEQTRLLSEIDTVLREQQLCRRRVVFFHHAQGMWLRQLPGMRSAGSKEGFFVYVFGTTQPKVMVYSHQDKEPPTYRATLFPCSSCRTEGCKACDLVGWLVEDGCEFVLGHPGVTIGRQSLPSCPSGGAIPDIDPFANLRMVEDCLLNRLAASPALKRSSSEATEWIARTNVSTT